MKRADLLHTFELAVEVWETVRSPEFREDPHGVMSTLADVCLGRIRPEDLAPELNGHEPQDAGRDGTDETGTEVVSSRLDADDQRILALAQSIKWLSSTDVAELLRRSQERARQRLTRLAGLGYLCRVGQTRATRYCQNGGTGRGTKLA